MRIYEERRRCEMLVEKIWRVFVERRRCETSTAGCGAPGKMWGIIEGAPKVRNVGRKRL